MKYKKVLVFMLLLLIPLNIYAYSNKLIASGKNIGIEVNSDGVLIVGFYKENPKKIGLKIGDIIKKINGKEIYNNIDIEGNIKEGLNRVEIERNKKNYTYNLQIERENNKLVTGIYIKSKITGIGTLTYIDPETRKFGALGHEIDDSNTMTLFKIKDGTIFKSQIIGIEKSERGIAGEKKTIYDKSNVYGNIKTNINSGIFGIYTKELEKSDEIEIGDVHTGEAEIKTEIDESIKTYKINIISINRSGYRNMLFEITDKDLIDKTGGIVQGMSGSPILQDNKIVGAVTHVIVDDPKKGYGIDIRKMLN